MSKRPLLYSLAVNAVLIAVNIWFAATGTFPWNLANAAAAAFIVGCSIFNYCLYRKRVQRLSSNPFYSSWTPIPGPSWSSLQHVKQEEPIVAWKEAIVTGHNRSPGSLADTGRGERHQSVLVGTGYYAVHFPEAYAGCLSDGFNFMCTQDDPVWIERSRRDKHKSPNENCSCGFYARNVQTTLFPQGGLAILKVELAGKILAAQWGYRAEWQRILEVWINPQDLEHKASLEAQGFEVHVGHPTDHSNGQARTPF